jgi:hypothetical protein
VKTCSSAAVAKGTFPERLHWTTQQQSDASFKKNLVTTMCVLNLVLQVCPQMLMLDQHSTISRHYNLHNIGQNLDKKKIVHTKLAMKRNMWVPIMCANPFKNSPNSFNSHPPQKPRSSFCETTFLSSCFMCISRLSPDGNTI